MRTARLLERQTEKLRVTERNWDKRASSGGPEVVDRNNATPDRRRRHQQANCITNRPYTAYRLRGKNILWLWPSRPPAISLQVYARHIILFNNNNNILEWQCIKMLFIYYCADVSAVRAASAAGRCFAGGNEKHRPAYRRTI